MFVRRKKNPSGKVSVQVIDKSSGSYKVIKTIGSSSEATVVDQMVSEGQSWIEQKAGLNQLDFSNDIGLTESVLSGIQELRQVGLDLLLGRIFDQIGFNQISDPYFKYLVLYRLAHPHSKLKTTEYLYRYHRIDWHEDQLYRYLDKLYNTQTELVQQISFNHTKKILDDQINVVFYDVTTLYFEIDQSDELRKTGFSKEGKHQNPQIVLGLLVSRDGYPLTYEIFEGNQFEGRTMLPVINAFIDRYKLGQLIIVADSGLLSKDNVDQLQKDKYQFILGARIKNETDQVKQQILALTLSDGQYGIIEKGELRLIITYSSKRARKDLYNRNRGLDRLKKQITSGKLTKSNINKRGYNKYLKMKGNMEVTIDKEKFEKDAQWDGLKGYLTNAKLPESEILENYQHLWQIEKAFRVAKTDLKIRPIFHRLQRRIEAHICLTFSAYKIFKELDRQLNEKNAGISPQKAIEIAKSIFEIKVKTPSSKTTISKTILTSDEQKYLAKLFEF